VLSSLYLVKCHIYQITVILEEILKTVDKKMDEVLTQLKKNPRVKNIRLIVSPDCCPACAAKEGTYEKDDIISLPIEGCSNPVGCRCFYEPMLNIIYP